MAPRRIGELLVSEGLLSESEIHRALGFQRLSGERIKIGSILLNWDLLREIRTPFPRHSHVDYRFAE